MRGLGRFHKFRSCSTLARRGMESPIRRRSRLSGWPMLHTRARLCAQCRRPVQHGKYQRAGRTGTSLHTVMLQGTAANMAADNMMLDMRLSLESRWLRRRVPFLPPPGTHGRVVPPSAVSEQSLCNRLRWLGPLQTNSPDPAQVSCDRSVLAVTRTGRAARPCAHASSWMAEAVQALAQPPSMTA